jgi:hypothetical protein
MNTDIGHLEESSGTGAIIMQKLISEGYAEHEIENLPMFQGIGGFNKCNVIAPWSSNITENIAKQSLKAAKARNRLREKLREKKSAK